VVALVEANLKLIVSNRKTKQSILRWTEDNESGCIEVLTASAASDEHVCVDVMHHLDCRNLPSNMSESSFAAKCCCIFSCPILPVLWCNKHGGYCFWQDDLDTDDVSLPCTDWSPSGGQLGCNGQTVTVILCWMRFVDSKGAKLIWFENVPEFPISLLENIVCNYRWYSFYMSPSDVGYANTSGTRLFILGLRIGCLIVTESTF